MLPIQQLQELIQGKKVAFIGAGVSHKRCIEQFVELGAQVTLCDQKKSLDDFGDYADTLRRLKVNLSLGEHYTDGFAGQDIIMRTPGYEYYKPALQAALKAGADLLLFNRDHALHRQAIDEVEVQIQNGTIPMNRLDAAVQRVLAAKEQYGLLSPTPAAID